PTCTDCAFIGFQQNLFDSFALCDPFFSPCIGDGRFHHRGQRPDEERAAAPSRTIALSMRASSATAVIPRDGRAGGGGGTGFARGRVAAGRPRRTGERARDGAGTGTRRGRKRLEGGRGSGSAGDGPNPGDRPPTGAILRSPGACSRHAYGRSAALTGE